MKEALIALVMIALLLESIPVSSDSSLGPQRVTFTVAAPEIGFSASSSIDVEWTDHIKLETGEQGTLAYNLASAGSVLTLLVPLHSITFGFVDDQIVSISVPLTPIGVVTIPLLEAVKLVVSFGLLSILSNIASIDLVLESEIVVLDCGCALGTPGIASVVTSIQTVQWQSWGTREIQIHASNITGSALLTTTFGYALSLGLRVSVAGQDWWPIPSVIISATTGEPAVITNVDVVEPTSMTAIFAGAGIAVAAVAGILIFFAIRKRKKNNNNLDTP